MPEIEVLLFGKAADLAQKRTVSLQFPDRITYQQIQEIIFEKIPEMNSIKQSCFIAIDQKYGESNKELDLTNKTEIAVIPPIAGG